MRSVASFALVFSMLFPAASIADSTKEIQKLEKTLAGDRDASARADAAWQLGQRGATDSWVEIAEDDPQCPCCCWRRLSFSWHCGR